VKFWLMNHLVNPLVRAILRSPVHGMLSRSLLILTYSGRRTGRMRSLPVMYAEESNRDLVIFAGSPDEKTWWKNLIEPAPVSIILRGRRFNANACAIPGGPRVEAAWKTYTAKFPKASVARKQGEPAVLVCVSVCMRERAAAS
jgi:deazaflavin-dependent oxidoreductase (nitroreductase family)